MTQSITSDVGKNKPLSQTAFIGKRLTFTLHSHRDDKQQSSKDSSGVMGKFHNEMLCTIWYRLCHLKNVKKTYRGVLP